MVLTSARCGQDAWEVNREQVRYLDVPRPVPVPVGSGVAESASGARAVTSLIGLWLAAEDEAAIEEGGEAHAHFPVTT